MTPAQLLDGLRQQMPPGVFRDASRLMLKGFSVSDLAEWNDMQNARRVRECRAKRNASDSKPSITPTGECNASPEVTTITERQQCNGSDNDAVITKEAGSSPLDSLSPEETPGKKENPLRGKKNETAPSSADPRHKPFIDGYTTAYHEVFSRPYVFDGGKDGTGVKRLLTAASAEHYSAELLAAIARAAMLKSRDQFARVTKFSVTIWQFCQNFNAISAEVGPVSATKSEQPRRVLSNEEKEAFQIRMMNRSYAASA